MSSDRRQRSHVAAARFTPEEWGVIGRAAEAAGLSVGQYLRALALASDKAHLPRVRHRAPTNAVELRRILGLLGNIASNINQIAHATNSTGRSPDAGEFVRALSAILELRAPLLVALGVPVREVSR